MSSIKLDSPIQLALLLMLGAQLASAQDPASSEFFESRIRPVLIKHCYECHSGTSKSIKGGLRVDWAVVDAIRFTPLDTPKAKEAIAKPTKSKTDSDANTDSPELATVKMRLEELNEKLKAIPKTAPVPAPTALAAEDAKKIGDCAICIRGEHNMPGNVVPRGFLTKLVKRKPITLEDNVCSDVECWKPESATSNYPQAALATDQPISGLLTDLRQRGMLDDTLVVWGGEFGRTPTVQGSDGRDHNPQGFTVWLAGGGLQTGLAYGETDEYGYYAQVNRVHIHDLHATILHLLGIDHTKLTYRFAGRDFRLTDVYGRVVNDILT
jgi:hypothetical protein